MPKTLQGQDDERAEREEQALQGERDAAMMEAQAAAEEEEAAIAAAAAVAAGLPVAGAGGQAIEEGGMNLDDEVPEAGGWESSDESDIGGGDENIDRENGIHQGDGEEISIAIDADIGASFTGAGDEGDGDYGAPGTLEGGGRRDLDDDVPEAGSYQHTDTEVEDESSFEEGGSFVVGSGGGGVLGRSVWGGSPVGVPIGGGDGAGGSRTRRASRRSGGRSSRGRESRG